MSRTGTGEVPVTEGFPAALLLQPTTLSTATLKPLGGRGGIIKSCKYPTIVTAG